MISATCPSYFKVGDVPALVDCMQQIAAGAEGLPFYYYHIPALTGSQIDVVEFLKRGGDRISESGRAEVHDDAGARVPKLLAR